MISYLFVHIFFQPKCLEKSDAQKSSLKCWQCDGCVPRCTGICNDCKNESIPQDILDKHAALKNKINEIVPYGAYPNKGWSIFRGENLYVCNQLIFFLSIEYLNEYENLFEESKNIFHANDADFRRLMEVVLKFRMEKRHYNKGCLEINKLILTNSYENLPMLNTAMKELTVAMLCNVLNMYEEAEMHINKAGLLIVGNFKLF